MKDAQKKLIAKTIAILERSRRDHEQDNSWCTGGCLHGIVNAKGVKLKCDCGADDFNSELDDLIEELKIVFGDPQAAEPPGIIHA